MKIYLDMVGCRLNQAEIEAYARQLVSLGHTLVALPEDADMAILNSCSVTSAAASDSRQKARQLWREGAAEIILTGCWATLNPVSARELPGVHRIIPNDRKDNLVRELFSLPNEDFDTEPTERQPVPGGRLRTRSFIKVQDGCNNRCAFCITTIARGRGRSRPLPEVIADIQAVCSPQSTLAAKEIVLTGVHMGSWGKDLSPALNLAALVRAVLNDTDAERVRLSSIEPWHLDENFFRLWDNPRLCRQLHLPLQSGSAAVLKRMARNVTPGEYAVLLNTAREMIPSVAVTTDIIAGFPGESAAEFSESLRFVEEMKFADGHVFTFSPRKGTPAARMPDQVPMQTRKERNARIRAVFEKSSANYRQGFLGQTLQVLWESALEHGPNGWKLTGLTDNYLRVFAYAPCDLWNQITPVLISAPEGRGLSGEIKPGWKAASAGDQSIVKQDQLKVQLGLGWGYE
jgi:threonylcarbamoyladenosine tRNA methylthiotransferase MtaB